MAEEKVNFKADLAILKGTIEHYYSFDVLQRLYKAFFSSLVNEHKQDLKEAGLNPNLFSKKLRKADLIELMAYIFGHEKLFRSLWSNLPSNITKVFSLLTWEGSQKVANLEKELKVKIISFPQEKNYYYYYDHMKFVDTSFIFFCVNSKDRYYYGKPEYVIFFPDYFIKVLKHYLKPPSGYEIVPLPEIQKTNFIFENKAMVLQELPLYYEYIHQGYIKLSQNGKPLKSSLQQLKKYALVQEFYEANKELEALKTTLMAGLIQSSKKIERGKNPLSLFKQIMKSYTEQDNLWSLENILFHLKGKANVTFSCKQKKGVNVSILSLLKNLPVSQWVSIENITRFVILREIDLGVVDKSDAARYLYFQCQGTDRYSYERKTYLDEIYYPQAMLIPLIKGSMFLFAAFGLVDMAYNLPFNQFVHAEGKDYLSVFDGAQYVRLTDLGAYIIGLTSDYTAPFQEEKKAEVILDENRLIITIHGEDRLKSMILPRLADKIGTNRYKVDYASFLKECTTKKDIQHKINLFKTEISPKPPQNWLDFFNKALSRVNPMESQQSMAVYKLVEDRELIHLVATDEILRKYILKADNYHIVIERSNFPKIKQRLENLGYLI